MEKKKLSRFVLFYSIILTLIGLVMPSISVWDIAVAAETQKLNIVPVSTTQKAGDQFSIAVNYDVTNNYGVTLLGLRVHYNSKKITFVEYFNIDPVHKFGIPGEPTPDANDFDGDPDTDKFVLISWLDTNAEFSGVARTLCEVKFTVNGDVYNGLTSINPSAEPGFGCIVEPTGMDLTITGGKDAPATPALSPATGYYKDSVDVTATTDDNGTIKSYYTTDGSDPDENNTLYSGQFSVDGNDGDVKTVKMRSYDSTEPIWGEIGSATYTFDKADPTGTITAPAADDHTTSSTLVISGTAADTGSGLESVEVSIDGGTTYSSATGLATWSYSAELAEGANVVKVKLTDKVGNVSTLDGNTITYYPALRLTVGGVDVTGEKVYVPNTAGSNTKTITVSGGSGTFGTYIWTTDNNPAVGNLTLGTSNEQQIYTATIDATGTDSITVKDPEDAIYTATIDIEVVDFSASGNKTTAYVGDTVIFTAQGNTGPVTWAAKSGADVAGSPVLSGTNDSVATYTLTKAGKFIITATDTDSGIPFDTQEVTVYTVPDFSELPAEKKTVMPGSDSDEFAISGGDGTYTWAVQGPSAVAGGTADTYTFTAPSTGNFAGTYTITATGSGGYNQSFDIYVPLKIEPDVTSVAMLTTANPYPFTLTGAADPTPYTVTIDSLDDDQPDSSTPGVFVGNMATFTFDPADYSVTADTGSKLYSLQVEVQGLTDPEMVDIGIAPAELFQSVDVDPAAGVEKDLTNDADSDVKSLFGSNPITLKIAPASSGKKISVAVAAPQKYDATTGTVTSGVVWEIVGLENSNTCVTIPVPCTAEEADAIIGKTKAIFYQNSGTPGTWKQVVVDPAKITYNGANSLIKVDICQWSSNIVGVGNLTSSSTTATDSSSSGSDCFISSLNGNNSSNYIWISMIAVLAVVAVFASTRKQKIS